MNMEDWKIAGMGLKIDWLIELRVGGGVLKIKKRSGEGGKTVKCRVKDGKLKSSGWGMKY